MVGIKFVVPTEKFEKEFKKIKDRSFKEKLKKQITKITENPNFDKPLRYCLKGEWTIYVKPYRLIYSIEGNRLVLLRVEHRNHAYER